MKKLVKKYQPGGFTGTEYNPFMGDVLPQQNPYMQPMDLSGLTNPFFNGQSPQGQPLTRQQQYQTNQQLNLQQDGWNLDSDGQYRKNIITEDRRNLQYNQGFQLLNGLMDATRLTANTITGIRDRRREREDYRNARYEDPRYNINEQGINNVPIMYQTGGETYRFRPRKTRADYETEYNTNMNYQNPINPLGIWDDTLVTQNSNQRTGLINWNTNSEKPYNSFADYNTRTYSDPSDRIGTAPYLSGNTAITTNDDGTYTYNKYSFPLQDRFALENNALRQGSTENSVSLGNSRSWYNSRGSWQDTYATGGQVPEVRSQGKGNIELEKGEVFQDVNGQIQKVAESENTHEDGGSKQPFAFRVLEDTSDKRKNLDSKRLKITPDEAEELTGFKPKKSVSHSKLFELSVDFWGKKMNKLQKDIDENLTYTKKAGDLYSQNSLDENMKLLGQLPTEEFLFNNLYEHQEDVKYVAEVKKSQYGGTTKYATGGEIPPWAWTDASSKNQALDNYYTKVKDLGYSGKKNIGDIQRYMVKEYPGLVDDYMTNRGIPNTNKGKQLQGQNNYTPQGAFQDDLWWYRSMLPENVSFRTQAELDNFISNKQAVDNNGTKYYVDPANKDYQQIYYNPTVNPNSITRMDKIPFNSTSDLNATPVDVPSIIPSSNIEANSIDPINISGNVSPGINPSRFNEPLRWEDTAGAMMKYIDSQRIPVDLEQLSRQPLNVRELNPLPTLLQNQGDYNAVLDQLPTSGVGFANQANLAANKYKANNEVLGSYENTNKQRRDQIDQYNDQNQFALDQTNMALRDQFNTRILQGREVERQQKFAALDGLFNKIALNRKLNREGDLMLQMSPYFDQYANFNGNPMDIFGQLQSEVAKTGGKADIQPTTDGGTKTTIYGADGNVQKTIIKDKNNRTLFK